MINTDCRYECSDEECNMCSVKGYIYTCDGCTIYMEQMAIKEGVHEMMKEKEKRQNHG